jgi:23S rRNA (uracil1939-C5)-methyltransferase
MAISKKNRKNFYNQIIENIIITGVAAEGKAIARYGELVVFIKYGAPGDVADIRITRVERRHLEAEIIKLHTPSPLRDTPFCEHFGVCGGCKWQHLQYSEQLKHKQQQVVDSLKRIGKVDYDYHLVDAWGSEKTRFYRNKLEFTFADRRWFTKEEIDKGETIENPQALGFHVPNFFDKVLDIHKCWLQPEPTNSIRNGVKEFAIQNHIPFFNFRDNTGLLRNMIVRNNDKNEFMVILICTSENDEQRNLVLNYIRDHFPQVISLHYMINDKKNSSYGDLEPVLYHGHPYLVEEMEGLKFKVGPRSFYQTNSQQAYNLYKIAREFAQLNGTEHVYDLYTGTGTIAIFVARQAARVTGIEYVEEAVEHARENASMNGLSHLTFTAGDMAKVLTEDFFAENGHPDVIITDPPRAGMHPDVTLRMLNSGAKRIVYVSCNPATQARDIELLAPRYKVIKAQAVDMFPHTQHVESVVLLEKTKS